MTGRAVLAALGVGTFLVACTDSTGPPIDKPPPQRAVVADGELHSLDWNALNRNLGFSVAGAASDQAPTVAVEGGILASPTPNRLGLDRYRVSFWAVKGKTRWIQINYLGGFSTQPFLRLVIPRGALYRYPDGSRVGRRDSVLVTVLVDPKRIRVELEPSGLRFSRWRAARLQIWYAGVNGDFNGDGVVDRQDAFIERHLLGIWVQEEPGGPWTVMAAEHSTRGKWFKVKLPHFSGYEVAF